MKNKSKPTESEIRKEIEDLFKFEYDDFKSSKEEARFIDNLEKIFNKYKCKHEKIGYC